jgi:hypothetical protein
MLNNSKVISEDDFLASLRIHPRYLDHDVCDVCGGSNGCDDGDIGDDIDFEASVYRESHLCDFMGRVLGDCEVACWWKTKAPEWLGSAFHCSSKRGSFWDLMAYLFRANDYGNEIRFSMVPLAREVSKKKSQKGRPAPKSKGPGEWVEKPMRSFAIELENLTEDQLESAFESASATCAKIGLPYCHLVKSSRSFTFYWNCSEGVPLPLWRKIQARLVEIFGADSSCASPQKEWHMPLMIEWCGVKVEPEPEDDEDDGYFFIGSTFTETPSYSLKAVGAALGIEVGNV